MWIADWLRAGGVDRILAGNGRPALLFLDFLSFSVDLHSAQIQGQFQHCPVDNLSMFEDMAEFFMRNFYKK